MYPNQHDRIRPPAPVSGAQARPTGATGGLSAAAGPEEGAEGPLSTRKRRRGRRGGQRHRRRREAREARIGSGPVGDGAEALDAGAPAEMDIETPEIDSPEAGGAAPVERPAARPTREARGGRERGERGGKGWRGRGPRRGRNRDDEVLTPIMDSTVSEEDAQDARPAADELDPAMLDDDEMFPAPIVDDAELAGLEVGETAAPAAVIHVEPTDDPRREPVRGKQEMLINFADHDECRIALVGAGRLDELYMERAASVSHVGNIYKGRVTNVESSIQAAFVDFGLPVHGFLHISDLHPQYFPDNREGEQVGRKTPRRERPPIQRCLRRGQEVIVQITKEGIGTKGPTMTTYISLPGRFLVMMPGMAQLGISRKVEDDDSRRTARALLNQLKLPKDMGFIMRTAGIDRTKRELQHDLNYLARLWRVVERRIESQRAPCELYQESDLVIRTVRDVYDDNIGRIVVDDERTAKKVAEFLSIANPRGSDRVVWYQGTDPLFHLYDIEQEIEKLHSRHVPLPCGGSLVIDPTEALVAIDVNSGRFRVPNDAEMTALRVNLEAADEIARQLRLRDLGGVIICDFIDMRFEKHRREVERRLANGLKDHKERAKILSMSQFGIIEMTRQRHGPSISRSVYADCPHCSGSGLVKTVESMTLDVLRVIQLAAHRENVNLIDVRVSTPVAAHLLNRKRHVLSRLEGETGRTITITAIATYGPDQVAYSCTDRRGREIPLSMIAPVRPPVPGPQPHARKELELRQPPQLPPPEAFPAAEDRSDVAPAATDPPRRGGRDRRRGRGASPIESVPPAVSRPPVRGAPPRRTDRPAPELPTTRPGPEPLRPAAARPLDRPAAVERAPAARPVETAASVPGTFVPPRRSGFAAGIADDAWDSTATPPPEAPRPPAAPIKPAPVKRAVVPAAPRMPAAPAAGVAAEARRVSGFADALFEVPQADDSFAARRREAAGAAADSDSAAGSSDGPIAPADRPRRKPAKRTVKPTPRATSVKKPAAAVVKRPAARRKKAT